MKYTNKICKDKQRIQILKSKLRWLTQIKQIEKLRSKIKKFWKVR